MTGVREDWRRQRAAAGVVVEQLLGAAEHVGDHEDAENGTADDVDNEERGDTPQEAVAEPDDDGDDDGDDREDHHADHDHAVAGEHLTEAVHAVTFHVRSPRAGGLLITILYTFVLILSIPCFSFTVVL